MFGESDSESPRVPSPWDHLVSTPPSPAAKAHNSPVGSIPKLVPEAEEGNIEYKLQLLTPSPARFARLVTQMKWRLLEGGGQAYYELGVADNGALVGLPRAELEQSLQTLEMMAGEIGASVIVVKEIEVPAVMAGLAGSETDYWNCKRRSRRGDLQSDASEGDSISTTEYETEFPAADCIDLDDNADHFYPSSLPAPFHLHPNGISVSSSPALDSSVTSFPMDAEFDVGENEDTDGVIRPTSSVDVEITSVFKPRPMRNRDRHLRMLSPAEKLSPPGTSSQLNSDKQAHLAKHNHRSRRLLCPASVNPNQRHSHIVVDDVYRTQTMQQAKAIHRRQARDRKRESKLAYAIPTHSKIANTSREDLTRDPVLGARREDTVPPTAALASQEADLSSTSLVSELALLHVSEEMPEAPCTAEPIPITDNDLIPDMQLDNAIDPDDIDIFVGHRNSYVSLTESTTHKSTSEGFFPHEPRLIVEALVVRKMSIEEAFLDFGRFSG